MTLKKKIIISLIPTDAKILAESSEYSGYTMYNVKLRKVFVCRRNNSNNSEACD